MIDHDDAQQIITFEYWHPENCPNRLSVFRSVRIFRISKDIENIDRFAFERGTGCTAVPARANWVLLYPLPELRSGVEGRRHPQQLAIETENESPAGPAQPSRTFGDRFKYRLEIERRAANDLKHFRGGRLLLQRFAELVEQAGILDGDDGLVGKVLDQLDLLVGKGPDFLPVYGERADQFVLFKHRHQQTRAYSSKFDGGDMRSRISVALLRHQRRERRLWSPPCDRQEFPDRNESQQASLACLGKRRWRVKRRNEAQTVAIPAIDIAELGVTDADGILQHAGKYRLEIAGRAGNDLQHFRGGRLLLQ